MADIDKFMQYFFVLCRPGTNYLVSKVDTR